MNDNVKTLFKHVETNDVNSVQMLSNGALVEAGYTASLGFYIYLKDELILFRSAQKYLDFAKENLTYIGDI